MTSSAFRPRCVLVTGGAGFIGCNLVRLVLQADPDVHVVTYDLLTYAGRLDNLRDVEVRHGLSGDARHTFVHGDVRDFAALSQTLAGNASHPPVDAVMHLAAESHVDRSIMGPEAFVETNVRGTLVLLEACRAELEARNRTFRFLHVGTDEVYGSLGSDDPSFTETTPLAPNSPYSASKAASDLLVRAWRETYRFPALITRCSNNYGCYQLPEKLIPLMITRALQDMPLPVYGDGMNVRDWLYVADHAQALWTVLTRGTLGEVYNIGGDCEVTNLDVVHRVLSLLGKPDSLIRFVRDRLGHDRRYAMNSAHLQTSLGWKPAHSFQTGLEQTVQWYLENETWWRPSLADAYHAAQGYLAGESRTAVR